MPLMPRACFGRSDVVLRMESYAASDATAEAKAIDARFGTMAPEQRPYGSTSERAPVEVYPGPPTGAVQRFPMLRVPACMLSPTRLQHLQDETLQMIRAALSEPDPT